MLTVTLWSRPGCSQSERAKELLEELGVVVAERSLDRSPPSREEIVAVLSALSLTPRALARRKEPRFLELGLATRSEAEVLDALVAWPELVERPIALRQDGARLRAALGRPPVRVLELVAPTMDAMGGLAATIAQARGAGS